MDSFIENCGIIFSLSVIESAPGKRQDAASTFTSLIFLGVQYKLFFLMQTQHPAAFRSAPCKPINRRSDENESIRHSTTVKDIKKSTAGPLIDQFLASFRPETERPFADSLQAAENLRHFRIRHGA